jgi:hypothetical protein
MTLGYDDDDDDDDDYDDDVGCNTIRPDMLVTRPCSTAMSLRKGEKKEKVT